MRRVETVSINGVVFSITDDACRNLSNYLDVLYKHFEYEKDGNEIIADIEARIAELFAGRAGGISQVITGKDVLNVIKTLGAPEDIIDSDSSSSDNLPPLPPRNSRTKQTAKRLYRNPDQSVLGGVCSGIASWLDISVIIVRLIFIVCLLLYGITIFVYFLLWIIIPMAKTTAQKLEMQGQPINISNIEKSIKSNMSSSSDRYTDETNRTPRIIWNIIRVGLGIILCLIGVSLALSFCSLLLLHDIIFEWRIFPFNRFFPFFISHSSYNVITVSAILFMILTVAACIYWGIKAITGTKVKSPYIHVILLIIWLITIPVAMTTFIRDVGNFIRFDNKSIQHININPCDTIYLNMKPSEFEIPYNLFNEYDDKNRCYYGKPNMYIHKSSGNNTLKITKTSRSRNNHLELKYLDDIGYDIEVENSQITISPYFPIDNFIDWKSQRLEIILYISENTVVIVDGSLCNSDIIVTPRQSGHDGNNCKWIMTHEGIKALD
jgi:phage shock protein PspC (stress-responsive transcriptional regulator)